MKKYTPSVKNNNELRDEVSNELKALIYSLEKGKYSRDLDTETVASQMKRLKSVSESFANAICCGDENIGILASDAGRQIKELKKCADQSMTHRFESAADELVYTIELWRDVLDGNAVIETEEEIERERVCRSRKKLDSKLSELADIKQLIADNVKRLEKEIAGFEKDLTEYDKAMLIEDNERKINEIFRNIKAVKSKINVLTVRQENYSACYNLLDMIYANAKEILQAVDLSSEEIGKAKALLNIDRLKKVLTEPDKAMVILKHMEEEIRTIASRTETIDKKIFGLESDATTVSEDALKYKEELIRKKRENDLLTKTIETDDSPTTIKTKIDTEE